MPRIGDEAWEVTWADPESAQFDDAGDVMVDRLNFIKERASTEAGAVRIARRVVLNGLDFFDCVRVRPVTFARPGQWEPSRDAEHYSRADFQETSAVR